MTFAFEESVKTIMALHDEFNRVKYNDPKEGSLRLAYVTALEAELAALHKICTETREDYEKRTAREVVESIKKR